MPLFKGSPQIPRRQFKELLKKTDIKIGSGRQLSDRERARIEKIVFPKRFGSSISKSEYLRTLNRLKSEKREAQVFVKKIKLGKEIKFLEELEKKENSGRK